MGQWNDLLLTNAIPSPHHHTNDLDLSGNEVGTAMLGLDFTIPGAHPCGD